MALYGVYSCYDYESELLNPNIITFSSGKEAHETLRRSVRDAFIGELINEDWCREHCYVLIGFITTDNNDDESSFLETWNMSKDDYGFGAGLWRIDRDNFVSFNCIDFISGLYEDGEEDDD